MKDIVVLFLIYTDNHLGEGMLEINKILGRMFGSFNANYVIVDNADSIEERCDNNQYFIHGDNSCFDFSGWDKGYVFAEEQGLIKSDSIILFANDTFFQRNYADGENFLDVFDSNIIQGRNLDESAIGYLDDFPKVVTLDGIEYKSWIRSNIFFIPQGVMRKLGSMVFDFPKSRIFSDDIKKFWSDDPLISANWKAYISSWLFGMQDEKFPEYKLNWLKSRPLDDSNWLFFQNKAMTILSEHYLTARLFDMKVPIIDTNVFPKDDLRHIKDYYKVQ
ncbi:hypothetical protein [Vibrio maerlii]|uniref:hypothetical protein n=1 Tax=Vibrio maerlii TaxID=2231648 RepID=UPI000E3D73D0|nr:hypothetical protein [Vibrio maerlii]